MLSYARVKRWLGLIVAAFALAACGSPVQGWPLVPQTVVRPCPKTQYLGVAWSPDGKWLAWMASAQGFAPQLFALDMTSGGARQITRAPIYKASFQWLPAGQALAYMADNGGRLIVVTLDGQESEIQLPARSFSSVAWSPDGEWLAYTAIIPGSPTNLDIHLVRADGSALVQLANSPGAELTPVWSPDGARLAFSRDNAIHTIRADGGDLRLLAHGREPQWSPDGQWLSLIVPDAGGSRALIVRPDGSDLREIVASASGNPLIRWLAGSQRLSFVSRAPDYLLQAINIQTLKVDTLAPLSVVTDSAVSWSPDGKRVAFVAVDHSNPSFAPPEIYLVNRDGSGLTRLTDNPGKRYCLHWPF